MEATNPEATQMVFNVEKDPNGNIKISFDSGSSAAAYWITDEEAIQLIDSLMSTLHPTK